MAHDGNGTDDDDGPNQIQTMMGQQMNKTGMMKEPMMMMDGQQWTNDGNGTRYDNAVYGDGTHDDGKSDHDGNDALYYDESRNDWNQPMMMGPMMMGPMMTKSIMMMDPSQMQTMMTTNE